MEELDGLEMRHLRYFLTVAKAGKISAASEELHIRQPSLSQLIKRLERRVGIKLFVRNPRGVALTPAGEVFRSGAEKCLEQLRTAMSEAGTAPTVVRVGVCAGVLPTLLTEIESSIAAVAAASPLRQPSEILFCSETSSRQIELLRHGDLELGIVRLPVAEPDLVIATASEQTLGVVTHIEHPLATQGPLTWHDLRDQRLLWFDNRRAPGYAKGLLAELRALGWVPDLHSADSDRHVLFTHQLRSVPDLVALRPEAAVDADPQLVWHRIAEELVPYERLGVATPQHGSHARTVREIARARQWPIECQVSRGLRQDPDAPGPAAGETPRTT
ncbi:MAG: LysR family transcriptional regulator [Sciscionella sp.]